MISGSISESLRLPLSIIIFSSFSIPFLISFISYTIIKLWNFRKKSWIRGKETWNKLSISQIKIL